MQLARLPSVCAIKNTARDRVSISDQHQTFYTICQQGQALPLISLNALHPKAKAYVNSHRSLGLHGSPESLERILLRCRLSDMRQLLRARLITGGHVP